ncbi:MAG TPA: GntR family transcriptional regulator [Candidatus Tectomicrobia bacterium]|nr:GntR family transcriptional regulator [Candidatus Tectomicrobia bacterium]
MRAIPRGRPSTPRRAAGDGRRPAEAAGTLFEAPLRHRTLEEQAYEHIRTAIVQRRLVPGQRIVASAAARAAGTSRIPVLQALRRLESEGFVRINPHRDVVVSGLSPEEFRERFLLMSVLEALCIREADGKIAPRTLRQLREVQREIVAARRAGDTERAVAADGRFHRMLWEVSGLRQVVQILQNVWDRGEYYRVIMHARRGGFAAESLAEHEEILGALEAGDVARAARAVERHRLRAMERLGQTT